jgi:hypothetical protein
MCWSRGLGQDSAGSRNTMRERAEVPGTKERSLPPRLLPLPEIEEEPMRAEHEDTQTEADTHGTHLRMGQEAQH